MAPEVYRNEEYDTKVDVFSFALILHEVKLLLYLSLRYCLDFSWIVRSLIL